jgi:hypothetical protein
MRAHAQLIAYQRPAPIVVGGDEGSWPGRWLNVPGERRLIATTPGRVVNVIVVPSTGGYELWLDGNFARGFQVSVDGRPVGRVKDELSGFHGGLFLHIANLSLSVGSHTVVLTYPHSDLTPGSGDNELTSLSAIMLQPHTPAGELLSLPPRQAVRLCGRPLDWIELVTTSR